MGVNINRIELKKKGAWSSANAYNVLDVVTDSGKGYYALKSVPAGTLLSNTEYWKEIDAAGDSITGIWGTIIGDIEDQADLFAKLEYFSSAALGNNIADFHNAIPREKDITAYLTDGSLWDRIAGTNGFSLFEDLFVGDYLTADGQEYMIVDFDYYIRTGDSHDLQAHHLVMMPRGNMKIPSGTVLYNTDPEAAPVTLEYINTANASAYAGETVTVTSQETETAKKWNATMADPNTNTTAGGYKYSRMRQVIMKAADTIVRAAFGASHVKAIDVYYPNPADASASGTTTTGAWFKDTNWNSDTRMSICDLPNEIQVYGSMIHANRGMEAMVDKLQFSLFRYNRSKMDIRSTWWLRSVASGTYAANVSNPGGANTNNASHAYGVRPRFLLVA